MSGWALSYRVTLGVALLGAATAGEAGRMSGTVSGTDGTALAGAMVTVRDARGVARSVFTDQDGHYRIETTLAAPLTLRVRKRYFQDHEGALEFAADGTARRDVRLVAITDPKELSDAHPALSHFSRIAFDADIDAPYSRANFARDCLSCHQLGNAFTRWPRPAESWLPTVQRMHGYIANADAGAIAHRAGMLAAAFDGSLVDSRPEVPFDAALTRATIHQWPLPGTVVPHDAEYDRNNGRIYSSEMFAGEILETNLDTGETLHFELPADGMPPGGVFTRMGLPVPYGLTPPRAPHSLAQGLDGRWYLTDSIGASITAFDPTTRAFESVEVGNGALYPHTVRVDAKGRVWFTIAFSNQVGRFDPRSGEMKVVDLPNSETHGAIGMPIPYGIDVHPGDGSIWYAKLASDRIGRIDPDTLAITEFDAPVRAPRRQRFDAAGKLWIAGFSDGAIARLDTATMEAEIFALPRQAPGEIPAPYALAVHPQTQDVWVNDTMLDVVWRFIPGERRFITYPLPLAGTYTRDFTFTDRGWACTANNPIPAAALEGGVPELICIDAGEGRGAALTDH